jgi:hypothetical protein
MKTAQKKAAARTKRIMEKHARIRAAGATHAEESTQEATAPVERDTGERGANGAKRVSGLDAAAMVLAEAGEPLNTKEMVERMLAQGLWTTGGKTPAATIYAAILREINTQGEKSRFRKTERGHFELTHA